jgi:ComF family protein
MLALIKQVLHSSVDFLLPPRCLLCYERTTDPHNVCASCWQGLTFISEPQCVQCGLPFDFGIEEELSCAPCLDHPPAYDRMRSAVVYNDISRHLVLCFKHGDMLQMAKLLSRWMINGGTELIKHADLMVPVPLHRLRLLWRQYNQAAILTNEIASLSGTPRHNEILIRSRYTPSQGKRTYKERIKNVKSAIQINPKYADLIRGQKVLLVDDVYTTGATVEECCRVLKAGGAKSVDVLTFARVVKGRD